MGRGCWCGWWVWVWVNVVGKKSIEKKRYSKVMEKKKEIEKSFKIFMKRKSPTP